MTSRDKASSELSVSECPACGGGDLSDCLLIPNVPTNSCILLETSDAARAYPRGDITLAFCNHCGYLFNRTFESRLTQYSTHYEETQGFSPTFRRFHEELARKLVADFDLEGREVLEIGCGKGEFLALLAEVGGITGTGFDPAFDPRRPAARVPGLRFIQNYYTGDSAGLAADFVCCKMTLEHIVNPRELLGMLRRHLDTRPAADVWFMVPDATRILLETSVEDLYYEHCAYYTPASLGRLFRSSGFKVESLETLYENQYLAIHARPELSGEVEGIALDTVTSVAETVSGFADRYRERADYWRGFVDARRAAGESIVVWGGGSKAVAFLSLLAERASAIDRVIDINPHRQGRFLPGSGICISAPATLQDRPPGVVLVMNRIYKDEIRSDLAVMGLTPELVAF